MEREAQGCHTQTEALQEGWEAWHSEMWYSDSWYIQIEAIIFLCTLQATISLEMHHVSLSERKVADTDSTTTAAGTGEEGEQGDSPDAMETGGLC